MFIKSWQTKSIRIGVCDISDGRSGVEEKETSKIILKQRIYGYLRITSYNINDQ